MASPCLAPAPGIEPGPRVLEALVLPLHHTDLEVPTGFKPVYSALQADAYVSRPRYLDILTLPHYIGVV